MPEEKRTLAIRAMRNAQHCLEICLRRENYRNSLRYAVHYTHVCAAFAASFLIRIARLFPQELNLKKTAKDVEELAGVLSESELSTSRLIQLTPQSPLVGMLARSA